VQFFKSKWRLIRLHVCVSRGNQHQGSHKRCHAKFDPIELKHAGSGKMPYSTARTAAASSAGGAMNPPRELTQKEKACVALQLDQYYKAKPPDGPGVTGNSSLRARGAAGKVLPKSKVKAGGM
jgi:hypothetical protein